MAERRPFSTFFQKKIQGRQKRKKTLRPLFQTITMTLENRYDDFGKPLRRL
jgi:hypothetical protein